MAHDLLLNMNKRLHVTRVCASCRRECPTSGPCSVPCPTTHGSQSSWTRWIRYQPLSAAAGEATRSSARRPCSSWLGEADSKHSTSRLPLLPTSVMMQPLLLDRVAPNAETRVTGADRWKYFKRFIGFVSSLPFTLRLYLITLCLIQCSPLFILAH